LHGKKLLLKPDLLLKLQDLALGSHCSWRSTLGRKILWGACKEDAACEKGVLVEKLEERM
jgi:hypothetical protein